MTDECIQSCDYKPTIFDKIRWIISDIKYKINSIIGEYGRRLVRWSQRNSNYLSHVESEWKITFPKQDDMQDAIGEQILDMVAMFGLESHSGSSAGYAIEYIKRALSFEPFSPLTGDDSEWTNVSDISGYICYQNKRCSHVFKDDDHAYDIDGKVFVDPDGCAYTSRDSRIDITFPYMPSKPIYINVDSEGNPIDTEVSPLIDNSIDLNVTDNKSLPIKEVDDYNPDYQYSRIMRDIINNGDQKGDRTGVGTKAIWGATARFDMSEGLFPIITTKRVYWKTAIREMLWFLSGSSDVRDLLKQDVHIWSEWPHAKYLKANPKSRMTLEGFEKKLLKDKAFGDKWGDLGSVYGTQWRKWEGSDGKQYDQIEQVIHDLKHNPNSRRILFHAWKVDEIANMALPPCHMVYQFQVTSAGRLNLAMFQRSTDAMLGLPFNLVGGGALLLMMANLADLTPGEFVWFGTDVHLYSNHMDQVETLLSRDPREQPKMSIVNKRDNINDFVLEDFEMVGYDPHPPISAPVAV